MVSKLAKSYWQIGDGIKNIAEISKKRRLHFKKIKTILKQIIE